VFVRRSDTGIPSSAPPAVEALPRVSVVRLETYEPRAVRRAVEAALEPLGGLSAFVRPGQRVVLKPNFLRPATPDRAVTTHPEIIRQVARLVRERGVEDAVVTDSCGFGTVKRCAGRLGLAGDDEPFVLAEADDGFDVDAGGRYHRLQLSRRMVDADVLINLPKVKTHAQMVLTGAVKNLFGAVVGLEKVQWHMRSGRDPAEFARLLLHIFRAVSPALHIADGVVGMEGNGPGAGTPRHLGLLVVSTDAHALDLALCRILGIDPEAVFTLRAAKALGLLPSNGRIEVLGESLEAVRPAPKWRLARPVLPNVMAASPLLAGMLERLIAITPRVHNTVCTACGECVRLCAPGAMSMGPGMRAGKKPEVIIDRKRCISCFCCQEMCPSGAITVKAGWLAQVLGVGTR
jgi:uncharacterized protein (DUF362 family)/NAD-dependent dihydropyrimidine dehydrogenase PreA subunit